MFNVKDIDENLCVLLCSQTERDNLGIIVSAGIDLYRYTDLEYYDITLKDVKEVVNIFSRHKFGEVPLSSRNLKTLIYLVEKIGIKIVPNLETNIKKQIVRQFSDLQNWDTFKDIIFDDDLLDDTLD